MTEYRVLWEIDITADSPEEAARIARAVQLDPQSTATVFSVGAVCSGCGEVHEDFPDIDLEKTRVH